MRASDSLISIFGVVPEATRAWNPEIAPHAILMKQNGKIVPPNSGPVPFAKTVTAGSLSSGRTHAMPTASRSTVPSLTNVER
jgi:hypothetical protein